MAASGLKSDEDVNYNLLLIQYKKKMRRMKK